MKEFTVSGTLVEAEGEIIALLRNSDSFEGQTWGLPAGRIQEDEEPVYAALRELTEETQLTPSLSQFQFLTEFNWGFPNAKVNFFLYKVGYEEKPDITIDPQEHQRFMWFSPEQCYQLPNLIHGFKEVLEYAYGLSEEESM